jgi:hypothetical protein
MPLPEDQVRALKVELANHDKSVSRIKRSIDNLQAELVVHQTLIGLGRNPRLLQVLNDMSDHPERAGKVANPVAYLAEKSIGLPQGTTVIVTKSDSDSVVAEAHFKQGGLDYRVEWDSKKGFVVDAVDQRI